MTHRTASGKATATFISGGWKSLLSSAPAGVVQKKTNTQGNWFHRANICGPTFTAHNNMREEVPTWKKCGCELKKEKTAVLPQVAACRPPIPPLGCLFSFFLFRFLLFSFFQTNVGEPCPAPLRVAMRAPLPFPGVPDRPSKILLVQVGTLSFSQTPSPLFGASVLTFIYLWTNVSGEESEE